MRIPAVAPHAASIAGFSALVALPGPWSYVVCLLCLAVNSALTVAYQQAVRAMARRLVQLTKENR